MELGKDLAELTGGQTILFRTEPTALVPDGRDYSANGIPPDVEVRDSRSKENVEQDRGMVASCRRNGSPAFPWGSGQLTRA